MAFKIVDCDNVRESFTSTGTTITAGGAVANSRSFVGAGFTNGDTFLGVARKGAEFSAGIFTWSTGGSIAQTTVWYSTNANAAVSFSSGSGEIFMDAPSRLFDELNLLEISVASATTCDIGAAQGGKIVISGTTPITSLGTTINKRRFVRFSGALTLTHNATSLILPGAANITTAAGDTAGFMSDSSGNWRCYFYQRAAGSVASIDGTAGAFTISGLLARSSNDLRVLAAAQSDQETASSTTLAVTPGRQQYHPSAAKAWALIDQRGTLTLTASYNISSLTDNAAGDTTFNLTTSFSSANYAVTSMGNQFTTNAEIVAGPYNLATGSFRVVNNGGAGVYFDTLISVSAAGDQ